ncbi:hypothetical protein [Catellatospora sp. TT07R-123]|uniref:hypothetical protein n=1 Tax=Catellatospora sp. TT07R-123 TaxID=2733863 RepID=UPI001BB2F26E|nr:hypothetical protein [Catellatospora sp. TT07R-123]
MTPPHPTQTARLHGLAAGALCTGILGLIVQVSLSPGDDEWQPAVQWLIVVSFALFLLACAAGIFGWLMREHEIWRQGGGVEQGVARAKEKAEAQARAYAEQTAWSTQPRYADEAERRDG